MPLSFDQRFRAVNDWLVRNGFRAGFPNCHSANYNDGRGTVYGTILLRENAAEWRDVFARDQSNPNPLDFRERLTHAHDYAGRQGFAHGFPNFHEADYGEGIVYGTFLIKPGAAEWRDVPTAEMGIAGDPWNVSLEERFWRTNDYAGRNGFPAGMPNGHLAQYDGRWVAGTILFRPGYAEWRDIPGRELGFPEERPPPLVPPSGLIARDVGRKGILLNWQNNTADTSSFKLERKTDGTGGFSQIAQVPTRAAAYSDTGLTEGTMYVYRVKATTPRGDTGYSGELRATPKAKRGSLLTSLWQTGGPSSFNYQVDVLDPLAGLNYVSPHPIVRRVENTSGRQMRLTHNGVQDPLDPGRASQAFNTQPAEGIWHAQVGGSTTNLPATISVKIDWEER